MLAVLRNKMKKVCGVRLSPVASSGVYSFKSARNERKTVALVNPNAVAIQGLLQPQKCTPQSASTRLLKNMLLGDPSTTIIV